MRIKGKIRGDMVGCNLKHNAENGARFAYVKLAVKCDRDRLKALFGAELERVAFSSLVTTGGDEETPAAVGFGYKEMKPDLVCEYHEIVIFGKRPKLQPVIKMIKPVKDRAEVTVEIEFPILFKDDKDLAGALATNFGELVDIELEPSQMELPGSNGAAVAIKKGAFGNPEPVVTSPAH